NQRGAGGDDRGAARVWPRDVAPALRDPVSADAEDDETAQRQKHDQAASRAAPLPLPCLLDQSIGRHLRRFAGRTGIGVRGGAALTSASVNSTLIESKLDRTGSLPLFEQVAAEIRRAIADGEIGPGERLPTARALAAVLGVNANTVFRALRL